MYQSEPCEMGGFRAGILVFYGSPEVRLCLGVLDYGSSHAVGCYAVDCDGLSLNGFVGHELDGSCSLFGFLLLSLGSLLLWLCR